MRRARSIAILLAFIACALPVPASAETVHDLFEKGNGHYWRGEYREAVDVYYEIMRSGIEDTDLWFNTATAYARMGEYGRAAYFYEKVLRVRPRDSAAQHNLDLVRQTVARELSKTRKDVDVNPHESLWEGILSWFTSNELAIVFIFFYYAFFLALVVRHFMKRPVGRVAATIFLSVFLVVWLATGAMLFGKYRIHHFSHEGVVLEKGVVMVHEGPSEQSPRIYDVIEAQKVDVVGVSGDWVQIRDEEGREGWLTSGEVGRL